MGMYDDATSQYTCTDAAKKLHELVLWHRTESGGISGDVGVVGQTGSSSSSTLEKLALLLIQDIKDKKPEIYASRGKPTVPISMTQSELAGGVGIKSISIYLRRITARSGFRFEPTA